MGIRRWGLWFALLAILGWGCDGEGELGPRAVTSRPTATATPRPPSGTAVTGGVDSGGGAATPTPAPSAPALLPRVERLELSTVAASVSLNPYDTHGNPKDVPGMVRLLATVVYSDGLRNDLVTWTSLNPGLVEVSEQGEVRPAVQMGPPAPGSTSVVAASRVDPTVTATCTVNVVP